jgi:hydroxymethylbilane synthase
VAINEKVNLPLRIGTRGSRLALWQAHYVADRLRPLAERRGVELVEIETAGDQVRDRPLSQIGGDGVFTKEIQRALLAGGVDVAVHSLKDLPTTPVEGLVLAAVPPRGPVSDVLISRRYPNFDSMPSGAKVATSSLRRRAQVLHRRPDLQLVDVRGNIETRLGKLVNQDLAALILAQAGLDRLGLSNHISEFLYPGWMLPAVGQGALGLECRSDDPVTLALVTALDHRVAHLAVRAERELLRGLGGGCLVPIGAATEVMGDALTLQGAVFHPHGQVRVDGWVSGPLTAAEDLGKQLAQILLDKGAGDLLTANR